MNRPICESCNKNLASKRGERFRKKCDRCRRTPESIRVRSKKNNKKKDVRKRPWIAYRKDYCENEQCRWVGIIAPFQLSVDHIDGDKDNNDPSNLKTLCHNCHAMKTWVSQEYLPLSQRGQNVWIEA